MITDHNCGRYATDQTNLEIEFLGRGQGIRTVEIFTTSNVFRNPELLKEGKHPIINFQ